MTGSGASGEGSPPCPAPPPPVGSRGDRVSVGAADGAFGLDGWSLSQARAAEDAAMATLARKREEAEAARREEAEALRAAGLDDDDDD